MNNRLHSVATTAGIYQTESEQSSFIPLRRRTFSSIRMMLLLLLFTSTAAVVLITVVMRFSTTGVLTVGTTAAADDDGIYHTESEQSSFLPLHRLFHGFFQNHCLWLGGVVSSLLPSFLVFWCSIVVSWDDLFFVYHPQKILSSSSLLVAASALTFLLSSFEEEGDDKDVSCFSGSASSTVVAEHPIWGFVNCPYDFWFYLCLP